MSLHHRLRTDDGYVLVTALVLMLIMLGVALSLADVVDTGQERVKEDRNRETSLNLTEGVLYSQGFTLAADWPGNAADAIPSICTNATVQKGCPNPSNLAGNNFTNVDILNDPNIAWETRVRDNGAPLVEFTTTSADAAQSGTNVETGLSYSCAAPCRYDANGDKELWVQARAVVQDRPRNIVARLRLEKLLESTPQSAVMTGGFAVNNSSAQKNYIDATGSQVVVRCNPNDTTNCAKRAGNNVYGSVTGGTADVPSTLLTAQQIARMKEVAKANGTYLSKAEYGSCPPVEKWKGAVVYIEFCEGHFATSDFNTIANSCPAGGMPAGMQQPCINAPGKPGIVIFNCAQLDVSGKATFIGLLYFVNGMHGGCSAPYPRGTTPVNCKIPPNSLKQEDVFQTTGGFGIWGAIAIDGPGCMKVGSNGGQIKFDPNVFGALSSYGTVGLIQNSWRELPANG